MTQSADCSGTQQWAEYLATNGLFIHGSTGENLYVRWVIGTNTITYTPGAASTSWYNEIADYDFSPSFIGGDGFPDTNAMIGHFTQLVWKSSTHLCTACAKGFYNGNLATFVVSRYLPPGNVPG